jgi:hypothetical protein
MSYEINLAEVDVDGAVGEAAEEVAGDTRSSFLKKAGLGAGAMIGGGSLLSALAPAALAASQHGRPPQSFGRGDVGILNYALTLEYLEAAFYNGATAANLRLDAQGIVFLQTVTKDENEHVAFLKKALGSKAAKQPKFDFKGANTNVETFMATAEVLENTGVHAYSGQALNIRTPAYVKAAVSIAQRRVRHAIYGREGARGRQGHRLHHRLTSAFDHPCRRRCSAR